MNEKFFDLSKGKQDRIINGVLKVFAVSGYEQAATDEMVREAGISKGLLFHYFETKLGAYRFVYNYVVRYLKLELGSSLESGFETPQETVQGTLKLCTNILRTYPYGLLFLRVAAKEQNEEALEATASAREQTEGILRDMHRKAIVYEGDVSRLWKAMDYCLFGLMEEMLRTQTREDPFLAENYLREADRFLELLVLPVGGVGRISAF